MDFSQKAQGALVNYEQYTGKKGPPPSLFFLNTLQ